MNFKNCENNDLKKHISKLEAQLNCEVSIFTNKIESISNDFENRINTLLGKKSKLEILQQNMTLLQNELLSKNEIIKSLIEIQSSILYTMPKNTSPPNVNNSIIYNLSLSNVTLTFIHVFNNPEINRTKNKIMKHKNMMNYTKIIEHNKRAGAKPIG